MAKITVVGQAVVVTSSMKLEDIKLVEKYRPEALVLYVGEGAEKEPDFKIGTTSFGNGCISKYGVEFDSETRDEQKLATLTEVLVNEVEDIKGFVSDAYGPAVLKLNELEGALPGVIREIADMKARIDANITIQ